MVAAGAKRIAVRRIKLSLIWHQNLMADAALAGPGVLDLAAYQELFKTPRAQQPGPLTAPWPENEQQGFWEKYLDRWHHLPGLEARDAGRALVPLRAAAPVRLRTEEPGASVWSEGFLHAWGATLVLTLTVTGAWPQLAAAAERLVELRREKRFLLDGRGGEVRLEDGASAGLQALASLADDAAPGRRWEPFTICAVLEAGGDADAFDPADEEAARFMHAASTFSPSWEIDAAPPAAEAKVAGKENGPASHLVYGTRRGRVIWSPGNFSKDSHEGLSILGCQYRNLVLASMQTEAMARFAEDTAARLAAGKDLASEHRSQAGMAVRILGELYHGSARYRSGSLQAQVEQNQQLGPIDAVRAELGMPAIV